MLLETAFRIVVHERDKFSGAVAGVAIAVFLMILQWGFYLGYLRDITVVLDSFDADIWFVPKNQPLFDGWVAIDDLPYTEARNHPAVAATARVVWGYAPYRLPTTGGKDTVEVLGFDLDAGVRLKLNLGPGDPAALLHPDGHVLVGTKDREKLGIESLPQEGLEISGRRATPVGYVADVHLFTTAGFILTDLDNGRAFLGVSDSCASYIVCKCRPGANIEAVARDLRATFPEHDVRTAQAFHDPAATYWSTRTSIGPVLLLSSGLAVLVGFLIVMLAFHISTAQKIPIFACMKALGASAGEVASILVFQVAIVFALGCAAAGVGLYVAVTVLARTAISVIITPQLVLAGVGTTGVCSALSSLLSIRKMISTDPGEAFRT
jgi:putative ABC transport system permease protein